STTEILLVEVPDTSSHMCKVPCKGPSKLERQLTDVLAPLSALSSPNPIHGIRVARTAVGIFIASVLCHQKIVEHTKCLHQLFGMLGLFPQLSLQNPPSRHQDTEGIFGASPFCAAAVVEDAFVVLEITSRVRPEEVWPQLERFVPDEDAWSRQPGFGQQLIVRQPKAPLFQQLPENGLLKDTSITLLAIGTNVHDDEPVVTVDYGHENDGVSPL
ncbi:unnamed protein product, partial [Ixodes hexagonus]